MRFFNQHLIHPSLSPRSAKLLAIILAASVHAGASAQDDHDHDHAAQDDHDHVENAEGGHEDEDHGDHDKEGEHAEAEPAEAESGHEGHDHGAETVPDEHEDEGVVHVDPEVLKEFDIRIGQVGPGTLDETVTLPGEIKFNREQVAYATPRFQGTVQEIRARLADEVKKGDVLATLENPETLRPFEVKAPFDGTVVAYDITPGQTVQAGAPLFTVADLSTVWADLQIYQRNLAEIKEGLPVVVKGGHGSATYEGEIAYIAPTIDEHTRTGLARVVVQNEARQWKPGQFIRGVVSTEEHPVDVMLPRSAILTMEDETVVFVQTDEGFEPRAVRLGHWDEDSFEVLEGLSGGETIVLRNPISLKAEMGKGAFGGHGHAH